MMSFSVIVPCYNPRKYLKRLLDSMLRQGIDREEFEVILCDDNSNEIYTDIIEPYWNKLNILLCNTKDREVHCPGNTRMDALPFASGEWICFCDQDDYFCDNTLLKVKEFSKAKNNNLFIMSELASWNEEENRPSSEPIINNLAWLHGKFYNRKNLIEKYHINFKENLYTHEDVYFNSCVYAELLGINPDWEDSEYVINEVTYHWVENPESITRSYFNKYGEDYLDEHIDEYIYASSEPYIKKIKANKAIPHYYRMLLATFLHAYFYWQSKVFRLGPVVSEGSKEVLLDYRDTICDLYKCKKVELLDLIHSDPFLYEEIRKDALLSRKAFIETTSLMDFMKIKR